MNKLLTSEDSAIASYRIKLNRPIKQKGRLSNDEIKHHILKDLLSLKLCQTKNMTGGKGVVVLTSVTSIEIYNI